MSKVAIVVLASVLAAGCTTVHLVHPQTGKRVSCGPYQVTGISAWTGQERERERACVEDFKAQGYVRAD